MGIIINFTNAGVKVTYSPQYIDEVNIPDPELKKTIRNALVIAEEEEVTVEDMLALTKIRARYKDIEDLTGGLEYATNLYKLELDYNKVNDLTPLSGLISLEELYLPGNNISGLAL